MNENQFSISALIKAIFNKDQVEKEAENAAKVAQQELEKNDVTMELKFNKAKAEIQIRDLQKLIKNARATWDKELEFQATLKLNEARDQLKWFNNALKETWKWVEEIKEKAEEAAWDDNKGVWKFMKWLKNTAIWSAVITFAKKLSDTLVELWTNYKKVADEFDRFTWNSEITKNLLEDLNAFSSDNWLDVNKVRETAAELLKMWTAVEDIIPTMQQLGDISAWTWASIEDLSDILWNINKEWKLTTDTFNDLVEAWVPIWDQLASDLWLTVDEVKKLASEWKITDEQVSTAFQHMTEEWGVFFWAMAEGATSFEGRMNTLKDTFQNFWERISSAVMPAFEWLIKDAQETTDALMETSQTWSSWMMMIQQAIYAVVATIRWFVKACQSTWAILWTLWSSQYTIITWYIEDFKKWFQNVIKWIWDWTIWENVWNNIAYWIWQWVNKAIEALNKLPWVNLKWVNRWKKTDIFNFDNTANAFQWAKNAVSDTLNDLADDWSKFWEETEDWRNNIWKTFDSWAKKTNATLRDMINENTKTTSKGAKDQTKAILDQKKEELKKLRDLKIQEVQNSTASEHDKQVKLLDIYNRYKDELIKLEGKTNDELLKSAEEYLKEYQKEFEKASKADQDEVSKSIKKVEEYNKQIEKLADKRSEYKNKATKSIREINNSIKELDDDFDNDIAERYNKVIEQITKLWDKEWMKWIWDYMTLDQLQNWGSGSINWIKIDEAIEYKKLLEEKDFLEKNLTEEQKKQAEILDDQTESERLMLEYQKKRAALMEEKAIYEAFNSQWDLDNIWKKAIQIEDDIVKYYDKTKDQYVEITDFKNQELARELENQQSKLTTEYQQLETAKNNELDLIESTSKKILARWQSDTKEYKGELNTRLDAVRSYVESVKSLLASIPTSYRAYWWTMNSWITMVGENWPEAIVARQSSYVQPRNAVQNYSNVYNNQNSLSINWIEIWSFNSVEDLLNWLKPYLTRRN